MVSFFQSFSAPFLTALASSENLNAEGVTNSVVDLAEAIHTYGMAVVIFAVFLMVIIILILVMTWNNSKLINSLMTTNESNSKMDQNLIGKLVDNALDKDAEPTSNADEALVEIKGLLKDLINSNNEPDNHENDYQKNLVGAFIDLNMAFKDISRHTLLRLKCDRIAIYVFHNGNKSMHGLPFFKMSCVHEWTSYGNKTLRGKSHVDIPLHLYHDFIENLHKYGAYRSEDVSESIKDDPSIKDYVAFSEVKALYFVGIRDDTGALAGFIAAEFGDIDSFQHDKERDEFVRGVLDDMILKVAPIICNKYIYKRE